MANGTDWNGVPTWVKLLVQLGPTAVIATGLVYWVTMIQGQAIQDHSRDVERQFSDLIKISQQICANTSETPAERQSCFR